MIITRNKDIFFLIKLSFFSFWIYLLLCVLFYSDFVLSKPFLITGIVSISSTYIFHILLKRAISFKENKVFFTLFYIGILIRFLMFIILIIFVYILSRENILEYVISYVIYFFALHVIEAVSIYRNSNLSV